jgi:hypothetical protein
LPGAVVYPGASLSGLPARAGGCGLLAIHAQVAVGIAAACLLVDPPAVGLPRGLPGGAQSSADLCPRGTCCASGPHRELAAVGDLAGDYVAEGVQFHGLLLCGPGWSSAGRSSAPGARRSRMRSSS